MGQANEENVKTLKPANKILEQNHESRLDTRAPKEKSESDSSLKAVGENDWTAHYTG
jgi:hypothetical protein